MWKVKTKRANVVTYTRPSVKAIPASRYEKIGHELIVYPCIKGWYELRLEREDKIKSVEFILKKDIRFSFEGLITIVKAKTKRIKRIQPNLIKFLKRIRL